MSSCDTLIRNALIYDGLGKDPELADLAIQNGSIRAIGSLDNFEAREAFDAQGLALAPGFIDTHTHDDLAIIKDPTLLPKLSQGVTTVVAGNCGISAAPLSGIEQIPEPVNLLGDPEEFRFATFLEYKNAVKNAEPAVNIAAFVGHTSLRALTMDRLDRSATNAEIEHMKHHLTEALDNGALGLSTGLAYRSAHEASTAEVVALAEPLSTMGGVYATHMRTESDGILDAIREATEIGKNSKAPTIISHLKCAGMDNWGRSGEVLAALDQAAGEQPVYWDCYPYPASSTVLDYRQIDERIRIIITRSDPHPEMAGKTLSDVSKEWQVTQSEAAERLSPAGAIYYSMSEADLVRIISHPASMIGSDGLPNDPHPHPRLWGTFPRVLAFFSRDRKLFSLAEAIRKMTSLPADRFGFEDRGRIKEGARADLVLFDPSRIRDAATFELPTLPAEGIEGVWVNGVHAYAGMAATGKRAGLFLNRK